MHGVPSIVCTMYNDNKQQGHVYCVCSSCFFYIKAVSTRLLTSKGIMYIKARNMVRPFNVKLTAVQSTIENQSAAYHAHSLVHGIWCDFRSIQCDYHSIQCDFHSIQCDFRRKLFGNSARSNSYTCILINICEAFFYMEYV